MQETRMHLEDSLRALDRLHVEVSRKLSIWSPTSTPSTPVTPVSLMPFHLASHSPPIHQLSFGVLVMPNAPNVGNFRNVGNLGNVGNLPGGNAGANVPAPIVSLGVGNVANTSTTSMSGQGDGTAGGQGVGPMQQPDLVETVNVASKPVELNKLIQAFHSAGTSFHFSLSNSPIAQKSYSFSDRQRYRISESF